MQKTLSVMNNLHKISNTIAENTQRISKENISVSVGEQIHVSGSQPTEGNGNPTAQVTAQPGQMTAGKSTGERNFGKPSIEQLERRYEEYLRSKRDLLERVNSLQSELDEEGKNIAARMETLQFLRAELEKIQNGIPADSDDKTAFTDRAEAATGIRTIEKMRIALLRLLPMAQSKNQETAGSGKSNPEQDAIVLNSLTFRQISRFAFIASIPLLIGFFLSAVIITLAIIGSFKGLF